MLGWLVPMVTAGLFGSVHCVGMCGGLIAVASDGATGARERSLVQLSYQGARLVSYLALGMGAGALGRALDVAGQAAGLGKAAAIVAGVTMTAWGLWAMLSVAGARFRWRLPQLRLLPSSALSWLGRAQRLSPAWRAALLGGSSALLPCGFLYAFALAGAATGSPWGGALVLGALWLGNLPALLGFGWLMSGVLSRLKRSIPLLSAASVFALGVLTLNSRTSLPAFAVAAATNAVAPAASPRGVAAPMPSDCPFHKHLKP